MWHALFLTLPTQPNAVRLRVWRALKTLGCGSLARRRLRAAGGPGGAVRAAGGRGPDARRPGQRARAVDARRCAARRGAGTVRPHRGLQPVAHGGAVAGRGPAGAGGDRGAAALARHRRGAADAAAHRLLPRCRRRAGAGRTRRAAPGARCALLARRAAGAGAARHRAPGLAQVPGQALGHARAALGRPAGLRLADPPLHRSRGAFRLARRPGRIDARAARRAGLRLRRRPLHARRRARQLRGAGRQLRPGRRPAAAAHRAAPCTTSTSAAFRCPRPPAWRPCCAGLREVHADDDHTGRWRRRPCSTRCTPHPERPP